MVFYLFLFFNAHPDSTNVGRQTLGKHLGSGSRISSARRFNENNKTEQSVARRPMSKHFSLIVSSNSRYQTYVAVTGNFGEKNCCS